MASDYRTGEARAGIAHLRITQPVIYPTRPVWRGNKRDPKLLPADFCLRELLAVESLSDLEAFRNEWDAHDRFSRTGFDDLEDLQAAARTSIAAIGGEELTPEQISTLNRLSLFLPKPSFEDDRYGELDLLGFPELATIQRKKRLWQEEEFLQTVATYLERVRIAEEEDEPLDATTIDGVRELEEWRSSILEGRAEEQREGLAKHCYDITEAIAVQIFNTLVERNSIKTCANENCGSPFTVQRGRSQYSQHRRDAIYCSVNCGRATAVRRYRKRHPKP